MTDGVASVLSRPARAPVVGVEVRRTPIGGRLDDFLNVVDRIYRGDPNYIRPLDLDLKRRLSRSNPFFDHADGIVFTAHRNGVCVGRCTAQIDRVHLSRYDDRTGFFGFFDTVEDEDVARALLDAASEWVGSRGMKRIRGPLSLNMYDESGCLVEGFDTPPMIMTPHHRPYQGGLIERAGFDKVKDLYAWRYTVGEVPSRARKAHDEIAALPEVRARHVNMKRFDEDVRTILDVFDDAWSDNWGHVTPSEREAARMADELRLVVIPELTYIAEIDGEPAAIALALPNVNELIRDFEGKLLPWGLPKLLYRLKVRGPKTARLMMLGIRKKYRNVRKYAGLSTYLYVKMNEAGRRTGVSWGELSWTLEDNGPVNVAIKFMGGKVYKRFRLYEREV
ncbi:MAG TPA: hypothetical protein VKY73_21670 [Polyangiaceae bacterium]|nr:hypothetical protein [Polyangiaceae bacterium]